METNANQIFEYSEENNISWKEIYEKIPELLKIIQQILEKKSENNESNITTQEFLKDLNLGIKADEPYIMKETDFDDINFYKYILKTSIYYLKQDKLNSIINKLNPPIFKHLIDLCAIIQMILKEEKNYEKRDVKYYIYHIANAFSDIDNKLEEDFKFLKCGVELLLKAYNINNYNEYFSKKAKAEIRRNFCYSIKSLLTSVQQYMIYKKYLEDENKKNKIDKIHNLIDKTRNLSDDEDDIKFLENVNSILNDLLSLLNKENDFKCIYNFIFSFKGNIPENLNDFYYSIFCFDYINRQEKYKKKLEQFTITGQYRSDFSINKICEQETKNSFLKYMYQFAKNKKMHFKLLSGTFSNKKYFEELLKDMQFRDKIINFYNSQSIKKFINERCNNKEKDKLMKKLPYLLNLMRQGDFWKQIMLFPMSKNKMASVENYLRIVINTEYVKYHYASEENKKAISNLLLFMLLIQEIFHFLRRLIFLGKKAKEEITPPNSYDKNVKENKEDKSNFQTNTIEKDKKKNKALNEEKQYGEIGKRLIRYAFSVDTIISISFKAGLIFQGLTLKDENEIESLKTILSNEHNSKATFSVTEIYGISHQIHDCRDYYCENCC